MPPRWLDRRRLAVDPALRKLQLRWAADDLWMRRVLFVAALVAVVGGSIVFATQPAGVSRFPGAGLAGIGSLAAYYFGRRR